MKHRTRLFACALLTGALVACSDADANEAGELEPVEAASSETQNEAAEAPPAAAAPDRPPAREEHEAAPATPDSPAVLLEEGARVRVRLAESVSTETHAAGQPFRGTVAEAVTGQDGAVVLPAGTEVIGTVKASRTSGGPEEDATLVLAVERLEIDGQLVPVTASVVSADVRGDRRDSTSETVGKVAIGTAAGAILGRLLGDDSGDALKGAAAGTVAGAVVAFTTRGGDASVEEGTVLVIELDEPVTG